MSSQDGMCPLPTSGSLQSDWALLGRLCCEAEGWGSQVMVEAPVSLQLPEESALTPSPSWLLGTA